MSIYSIKSDDSKFNELKKMLEEIVPLDSFNDFDSLYLGLAEASAVLFNLDSSVKEIDKFIKKIRKQDADLPVFVMANNLDSKALQKHQGSKFSADLYFNYPFDKEVIVLMLEEYFELDEVFNEELDEELDQANEEVDLNDATQSSLMIKNLSEDVNVSEDSEQISDKMDDIFAGVYVEEYAEGEEERSLDAPELASSSDEENEVEEFHLDDDMSLAMDDEEDLSLGDTNEIAENLNDEGLELSDFDEELSIDDNQAGIETSGDENSNEFDTDLMSVEGNDDDQFSLEDNTPLESEESLEPEEISPEGDELMLSDDLTYGGEGLLDLTEEDTGEIENTFGLGDEVSDFELSSEKQGGQDEDANTHAFIPEDLGFSIEEDESEVEAEAGDVFAEDDFSFSNNNPLDELESSIEEDEKTIVGVLLEKDLPDPLDQDAIESTKTSIALDDEDELIEDDLMNIQFSTDNRGESGDGDPDLEEDLLTDQPFNLPDEVPSFADEIENKMSELDSIIELSEEGEAGDGDTDDETEFREESEDKTQVFSGNIGQHLAEANDTREDEDKTQVFQGKISPQNQRIPSDIKQDYQNFKDDNHYEMVRLGETIKGLREDRELLIGKISSLEERIEGRKKDFVGMRAELDEKKIEIEVIKKRYIDQVEDLKIQLDLALNKKDVLEIKNKNLLDDFEKLNREKRIDINNVRSRERELEEKLELLKNDAEVQIRNRDHKILELKRRIDTLEFDIENANLAEKTVKSGNAELENKMHKVIRTLRSAITQLEDDNENANMNRQKLIKDNLDV